MPKYHKKPVVIEAFQLTYMARHDGGGWPQWIHDAWMLDRSVVGSLGPTEAADTLTIHALEGHERVELDDWIIQGIKGEIYPCKPDIFEATYELVEATDHDDS